MYVNRSGASEMTYKFVKNLVHGVINVLISNLFIKFTNNIAKSYFFIFYSSSAKYWRYGFMQFKNFWKFWA